MVSICMMAVNKIRNVWALALPALALVSCSEDACSLSRAKEVSRLAIQDKYPRNSHLFTRFEVNENDKGWMFVYENGGNIGGAPIVFVDKKSCSVKSIVSTQ